MLYYVLIMYLLLFPAQVEDELYSPLWVDPTNPIGTETNPLRVSPGGAAHDVLNRARVVSPQTIFADYFRHNLRPRQFSSRVAANATVTHDNARSAAVLTVTANADDVAEIQTKEYLSYQAGKGSLCIIATTYAPGGLIAGVDGRMGLFDENDGLGWYNTGTTFGVFERSSVSGTPVDIPVPQSSWNLDTLDGTGNAGNPSGIRLNLQYGQLFFIEFAWFGAGPVRYGLFIGGELIYVHQTFHANIVPSPYMATAQLPIRAELRSDGSNGNTMRFSCMTFQAEGGENLPKTQITKSSGDALVTKATGATRPILSIRLDSAHIRDKLIPAKISVAIGAAEDVRFDVIFNGSLVGASWADVGGNSVAEFDTSATSITGGEVIDSFYQVTSASGGSFEKDISSRLKVLADIAGTSDTLTLAVTAFTGNADVAGTISWLEEN